MRVVHVARTPVVGVPGILTDLMNKYMPGVDAACCEVPTAYRDREVYKTLTTTSAGDLGEADVVVIHNIPPYHLVEVLRGLPCVRMVHSQPSLIGAQPTSDWPIPFGVVAQYWPRTWRGKKFDLLPNVLDIYDERFRPKSVPLDRIKVAYFPSHSGKHPPKSDLFGNNKGPEETLGILCDFDLDVDTGSGVDFWECMERKRNAHIVIDECVTGGYHRASLEAASMGKVAVNAMDKETRLCLEAVSQCPSGEFPFLTTSLDHLRKALQTILAHRYAVNLIGGYAREWMEKYWDPRTLLERCYAPLLAKAVKPVDLGK